MRKERERRSLINLVELEGNLSLGGRGGERGVSLSDEGSRRANAEGREGGHGEKLCRSVSWENLSISSRSRERDMMKQIHV